MSGFPGVGVVEGVHSLVEVSVEGMVFGELVGEDVGELAEADVGEGVVWVFSGFI